MLKFGCQLVSLDNVLLVPKAYIKQKINKLIGQLINDQYFSNSFSTLPNYICQQWICKEKNSNTLKA